MLMAAGMGWVDLSSCSEYQPTYNLGVSGWMGICMVTTSILEESCKLMSKMNARASIDLLIHVHVGRFGLLSGLFLNRSRDRLISSKGIALANDTSSDHAS